MSLPTCLKIGTTTGFVGGLISSAYFRGAAVRSNKNDNPATFAIGIISSASLFGGPFIGAGAGVSYYGLNQGVKYLRAAPRSTQVAVLAIVSFGLGIKGAYTLGKY